jgi:hypothetical protein
MKKIVSATAIAAGTLARSTVASARTTLISLVPAQVLRLNLTLVCKTLPGYLPNPS